MLRIFLLAGYLGVELFGDGLVSILLVNFEVLTIGANVEVLCISVFVSRDCSRLPACLGSTLRARVVKWVNCAREEPLSPNLWLFSRDCLSILLCVVG